MRGFSYPPEKVAAKTLWNQWAQEGRHFLSSVVRAAARWPSPLEGSRRAKLVSGRPFAAKRSFVANGRGGVKRSSAALPPPRRTPPRLASRLRATPSDPPPPG